MRQRAPVVPMAFTCKLSALHKQWLRCSLVHDLQKGNGSYRRMSAKSLGNCGNANDSLNYLHNFFSASTTWARQVNSPSNTVLGSVSELTDKMSDSSSDSSSDRSASKSEDEVKQAQPKAEEAVKAGPQSQKKKKKNAPDRPQPAWLFPPDEENPVLNPKVLTEAEKKKLYEERMEAIRFLKYKSVSAPMKTAPPGQLLTLIGAFLGLYGFNSTGRLFTLERNARKKLDGWEDEIGVKLEKGMPDLVKIFKDWSKEWHERRELDMSSSDEDDDAVTKRAKMVKKREKMTNAKIDKADDTSSSGSDESSGSDSGVVSKGKTAASAKAGKPIKAEASSSGSSSSSTSDSDADDETDKKTKAPAAKSTVGSLVNRLKRKASPVGPAAAASSSESDSDSEAPANKKKKVEADVEVTVKAAAVPASKQSKRESKKVSKKEASTKAAAKASSSSGSSSDSSSSDSDSGAADTKKSITTATEASKSSTKLAPPTTNGRKPSSTEPSDSSATLGEPPQKSTSSDTSDSEAPAKKAKSTTTAAKATKRKRSTSPKPTTPATNGKKPEKTNVPFSRIPEDIKVNPKLASNAYVPYDYAEKAHQDLIVTKGKGFTKEKNKKKRGA